ncbi:MAG TPA: hypothetical protein VL096_21000 [Pirellulaceae bacterium]|nr:hypothetical protein [Pirellulaceae bacterium]
MLRCLGKLVLGSFCLVALASAGCGGGEPFGYVPVTGTVTYEDGTPIVAESLEVTFYPQAPPIDAKTHPRPGVCIVNVADGTFKDATSHKPADGIVPGMHKVTVQTFDKDHQPVKGILPPEYESPDTTPLTYDTASKAPAVLKVKKKQ